jgi:hypothetical protein
MQGPVARNAMQAAFHASPKQLWKSSRIRRAEARLMVRAEWSDLTKKAS